ncbi:MAG: ferritin-like domain-containing protein [Parvularculaceae bacterium]|nr:ferritin-like domain-containing protein [Parvularculaceae bacterium]
MTDDAFSLATRVLSAADPQCKCNLATTALAALNDAGADRLAAACRDWPTPPDRPARPAKPELLPPAQAPRRRLGGERGRIALLHAIAHIEFNAIDLAFDMAARFAGEIHQSGLDAAAFVADWFAVGADEARHFRWLEQRLASLGASYGDLPAHDGLWEAAEKTADQVLARLAIAPMVLEARGLDVTPAMAGRLRRAGDPESAAILDKIYDEEHAHVAAGVRWFRRICIRRGVNPVETFRLLVRQRFNGELKPPFNDEARALAGLEADFYRDWNSSCE